MRHLREFVQRLIEVWRPGTGGEVGIGRGALTVIALASVPCGLVVGCAPEGRIEGPTPTRTVARATATPEPSETPQPSDTPSPTATPEATSVPERTEAQVVEVVDGDTIEVRVAGEVYTVRYIGIDTPETKHPEKPVQWMGPEASRANEELVGGKTVYLEKDVSETDEYGRLLRYVFLADGTFVDAELVRRGYAQVSTYPPDVKYADRFRRLQQQARAAGRGLWGATPAPPSPTASPRATEPSPTQPPTGRVQIVVSADCSQFDAPGNDDDNEEEEWVCLVDGGSETTDMSGWRLRDEHGWTYIFPGFQLSPGARVRVVTGCGTDTADRLFWCKEKTAVWNNGGDTVYLHDADGDLVIEHSY